MEKGKVIISEGNRPFWHSVVASVFYTLAILLVSMFFFGFEIFPKNGISSQWNFNMLIAATACMAQGILFSSVKFVFFDLSVKRYKEEYRVGPFKTGRWKQLPEIEYVSVFRQPKKDGNFIFETNLWYKKNKHFNIYESAVLEPAVVMGKSVALLLKVNLLDATRPNNHTWINVEDVTLE